LTENGDFNCIILLTESGVHSTQCLAAIRNHCQMTSNIQTGLFHVHGDYLVSSRFCLDNIFTTFVSQLSSAESSSLELSEYLIDRSDVTETESVILHAVNCGYFGETVSHGLASCSFSFFAENRLDSAAGPGDSKDGKSSGPLLAVALTASMAFFVIAVLFFLSCVIYW
jgi:hypothetical protein